MSFNDSVVLVTVSGKDAPGITSQLTGVLAKSEATILDIGQAVIHGLLSLSILFELNSKDAKEKTVIKDLLFKATELGMKLEFQVLNEKTMPLPHTEKRHHYAVTLIGEPISAKSLFHVTQFLANRKLNIDRIRRLSEKEFSCVELSVSSPSAIAPAHLKQDILQIARDQGVDIALQEEGLFRRAKRLIVFDMDSTLIQNEVIDEFAREKGVYEEVASITHQAMEGKLNFDEALKKRVEKLRGLKKSEIDSVYSRLELTPGAKELIHVLHRIGYKIAVISGGFTCITDRFKEQLGLDYAYGNTLEFVDGTITGALKGPIVNAQRKADLVEAIAQQEGIELDQVIAIGDGANDLPMLQRAGLGVAFNAKPAVREQADLSLNQKNLSSIFYLLGISGRDQEDFLKKS